ncbi:MAG: DMT family transporter [Paraburkholderia sp.]|jgi:drug/metabolite transporter (DMT)-like permease|nr:DMT family transporter [Paraburkholderia sp.]
MQSGLHTGRREGVFMLAGGGLLMGTIGIFVEEARLGALTLVFFRCFFGMLALAGYCAWRGWLTPGQIKRQFTRRTFALAFVSGVLMVTQWVGFFDSIHRTSIAVATVVFHVQPFWVVLMGAALFHERLGADRLGWIAIAFAGLVLASGVLAESHVADHPRYLIGLAEALGGSVLYASVTLIAKSLRDFRPHLLTLIQCAVGSICLPLIAPFVAPLELAHIAPAQWGWLIGMGVLHTGLSYVLIYGALPKLTTPVIAVLLFVYPLTAIAVDAIVYGRALSVPQLAGMVLIVLASLGVNLGWRLLPPGLVLRRR